MRLLRFLPVLLLVFWLAITALAQSVSITITPESGALGTTFNITVQGLNASTEYSLAFIYEGSGATVLTTNRTANASGQLAINISSQATDQPGSYRVEVRSDAQTLAQAQFTMTPADINSSPAGNTGPSVQVNPHQGIIGAAYDIVASGLSARQEVTISITYKPDGHQVYTRRISADDSGALNVRIFTQEDDGAGDYQVNLLDANGNPLASDTFVVEAPSGRDGIVQVSPQDGGFSINISSVNPFADLTVLLISDDTKEQVFITRVRATVDGTATVEYKPETGTPAGTYTISVKEREKYDVATGSLTIGATASLVAAQTASLVVTPVSAEPGTLRIISGSGLLAGETITIEIRSGGSVIFTADKTADVNGTVALSVKSLGADSPGDYIVDLKRGAELVAEATLTIEGSAANQPPQQAQLDSNVRVEVTPPGGPIGTVYEIRVLGLQANETVTIAVMFNGRNVFASERTSDNTGTASLSVNSEEGDNPGTYTVNVTRDTNVIATGSFQVGGDAVQTPVTPTEAPATPAPATPSTSTIANMTIQPSSGPRGTTHQITVNGLTANALYTINVTFNGSQVYTVDRTADANGVLTLSLSASADDAAGDYQVTVVQDATVVAQGTMTVLDGDGSQPPATPTPAPNTSGVTVAIDPSTGVLGDDHTVTVSGLNAGEEVTIEVVFGGSVVYTTTRTADGSGQATVILTTEKGDQAGVYTVRVRRADNNVAAEAALTVNEAGTTPPTTNGTDVVVNITPASGPAGTSHAVSVRNLTPDETVTINVLFNGSVQYTVDKIADRGGTVMLRLVAGDTDPKGVYTIQVLRAGAVIGQADMTVEGGATDGTNPPLSQSGGDGLLNTTDTFSGSEQTYTFDGEKGQAVVIQAASDDFDTYLTLRDDSGSDLASNDDFGSSLNSLIGPFILPYSGTFTVAVSSYDTISGAEDVSGTFTVSVETTTFTSLSYGQPAQAQFSPDSTIQYFSFDAEEGDIIGVTVDSSNGIDTTLALNDPTGAQVVYDDDSGSGYDPEITRYIVLTPGTYVAVVSGFTQGDNGSVSIVVNREDARSLDTSAQQVRLNAKQTADVVTYHGEAGEQLLLGVRIVSGSPEGSTISVVQNGTVLMSYASQDIPAGTLLGFTIPESGMISIRVESDGTTAATMELSVTQSRSGA